MADVESGVVMLDAALAALRGRAKADGADTLPPMDEEAFRAFYERTARPVWAYLARTTGDERAADDLLQEAYYRFFRAAAAHASEAHRRNYLYRIATNLVRDRARKGGGAVHVALPEDGSPAELPGDPGTAERFERASDLGRALEQMKPLHREMLWLAYAEGASHEEIAEILGVKAANVRSLLSRARRKLAGLLRGGRG